MKHELRDPAELAIHPALKEVPEWSKEDPEFIALVESIREEGISYPIIVDTLGRIMDLDGRATWRAARRLQFPEVPVHVQSSDDVHNLFLAGLQQHRHLTISAFAYLAFPHIKPAFERARARRLEILKSGGSIVRSADYAQTVEAFAEQLGLHRQRLFEAQKVWKEFEDKKTYEFPSDDGTPEKLTLRQYFEPRILRRPAGGEHEDKRPVGLGAVLAGIASIRKTKGAFKKIAAQLELFMNILDGVATRMRYWSDFDDGEKKAALAKWEELISKLPDDLCDSIEAKIKARRKKKGE